MPAMTSIPSNSALNAICRLLADYKALVTNSHTLAELRHELGEAEFRAFQDDLQRLMKRMSAAKAVGQIISEAVRRKKAVTDMNRSRRTAE